MKILVICKIIDNFGDAGFCLRLSRALHSCGHEVWLIHDQTNVLRKLISDNDQNHLIVVDGREPSFDTLLPTQVDLIIEPFGTSSETTEHRFDLTLRAIYPQSPWLVIDYLSAESWVADFHLRTMTQASSGHQSTLFYPGFGPNSGGVIHRDWKHSDPAAATKPDGHGMRVLVFAYDHAPLGELMAQCPEPWQWSWMGAELSGLDSVPTLGQQANIHCPPWVPQESFHGLLLDHDLLFVRGEDSFVRAQLSGRPFVWQIYPTDDDAHAVKLSAFFELYTADWPVELRAAWRSIWHFWNRLPVPEDSPNWTAAWSICQTEWCVLSQWCMNWSERVRRWPDLVGEILTWRYGVDPTSAK